MTKFVFGETLRNFLLRNWGANLILLFEKFPARYLKTLAVYIFIKEGLMTTELKISYLNN